MPLVVPNIVRLSVIGELNEQEIVTIFDVDVDEGDGGKTREEACFEVAGDLLNNWTDHVLDDLVNDFTATEVRWVDLDSEEGSTGARNSTSDKTWPLPGSHPGNPLPNNTCMRVRKNLQGASRTTRRGEMRLAGIPEDYTGADGITLTPAVVSGFNDAIELLKDGINGQDAFGVVKNCAQVHTREGVGVGSSHISTFSVIPVVGTQRRRMPGYGV